MEMVKYSFEARSRNTLIPVGLVACLEVARKLELGLLLFHDADVFLPQSLGMYAVEGVLSLKKAVDGLLRLLLLTVSIQSSIRVSPLSLQLKQRSLSGMTGHWLCCFPPLLLVVVVFVLVLFFCFFFFLLLLTSAYFLFFFGLLCDNGF